MPGIKIYSCFFVFFCIFVKLGNVKQLDMIMKRSILFVVILALNLFAQDVKLQSPNQLIVKDNLELPDNLKSRVSDFFINISQKKIETAYSKLLLDSPIISDEDQTRTLISESYRAIEYYGNNMGYESIDLQRPAMSILRARYIGLHENYPVRWIFTFYKSPSLGWIVLNIKFDDLSQYYFEDTK